MIKVYWVLQLWEGLWTLAIEYPFDSAAKALAAAQDKGLTTFKIEHEVYPPLVF